MVSQSNGNSKSVVKKLAALAFSAVMAMNCAAAAFADNTQPQELAVSSETLQPKENGQVQTTALNIRMDAGTENEIIDSLKMGDVVNIISTKPSQSGELWYKVSYTKNGKTAEGYCLSSFIRAVSDNFLQDDEHTSQDTDIVDNFEEYLSAQGFPESYIPFLKQLHENHPTWKFTAVQTGLDWEEVVAKESVLGRNLVERSTKDSFKSMEEGAYDFANGDWYGLDGNNWVAASADAIKYYLDPRNFLNENNIFMFENLSYDEKVQNEQGVKSILSGTFMNDGYNMTDNNQYYTYAQTFMEAGKQSGVSPYHLASRARQEQGVNGTNLAFGAVPGYEGIYNFFNIQAYQKGNITAHEMGAKYASTQNEKYDLPWDNPYKSIVGGAKFIATGYISKEQDTLYTQKFDVVDGGNGLYAHQYMSNVQAAASESVSLKKAYSEEILAGEITFKIPVYENMPQTPITLPGDKSNNNLLENLSVSKEETVPKFSKYKTDYTIKVDENTSSINISAAPCDPSAKVSGTGEKKISGNNEIFKITVEAQNGEKRVYTLNVVKEAKKDLAGDVDLDGEITIKDSTTLLNYIVGAATLDEKQLAAADMDKNGIVDVQDAQAILYWLVQRNK